MVFVTPQNPSARWFLNQLGTRAITSIGCVLATTSNAYAGVSTDGALQNGVSISKPLRSRPDREYVLARHFLETSSPKRF